MDQFLITETLIIELLLIVSIVAIAVRRLRIPYTVALVVVGLLITFQSTFKFELTPELILALFVPPLVFEAAFHLNIQELRRNLPAILLLAVPGVILTMFIIGGLLVFGIKLSVPIALLFGSLIAATDPVAVVALFRTLGMPKRLSVLIEGESLFNDGTAIVLFNLMLMVAVTSKVNVIESIGRFFIVSFGGIIVGLVLGWLIAQLISRVDNYLIETTLTTVLAFGSYLVAEKLGFSGVLAVLAAGLVNGNIGQRGMSPTSRIVIFNFWEYVAFLTNSLVFLLIGLQVNITALLASWQPILWAILAVFVARFIVVYGLSWLVKHVAEPIPIKWQHVLNWGDLRGAVSLALALSLPLSMGAERDLLLVMTFGVVLFTLLVQSTTMSPLVRWLKIITRSDAQVEYELQHARLTALRSADSRLDRLHNDGMLSSHTWEKLKRSVTGQAATLAEKVRGLLLADPELEIEELDTGWREMLRAQRSSLLSLRQDGVISDEVFEQLSTEVDSQLSEGYPSLADENDSRTQFLEITLPDDSEAIGKTIAELAIPRAAVLVSIQRGDETIIPRGDTRLHVGDVVTTLCERDTIPSVKKLLLTANGSEAIDQELPEAADD
ncbi:MAG: Na+/H+ antiporter [Chloroflexi bacterium RBG_13_50_21]|nr:MAG: Na+/H+ antiporter [Chloroflexi bacterium RBG_13_50_21]